MLAGLLAMHGLGPHSEDHTAGHLPRLVALVAAEDNHAAHDQEAAEAETASPVLGQGASNDSVPSDEGGPGLGECLALLGLLFALAISAVIGERRRSSLFVPRRVREPLVLLGRPPDAPCLHRLSILRC
ncbi:MULTISPECIES: hypothetical protein [Nocardioides]|uniref:Uncharacterized protein n=1 Tax=Nocardioides vastitatis TaxID=2568655 RepID=A0ABW0ZKB1_9ACTN|nr:hypothetical protein [Nocardioides sp.]THJ13722.1 hypothetical protein E7Z54_01565 [Nocardioides sp.]